MAESLFRRALARNAAAPGRHRRPGRGARSRQHRYADSLHDTDELPIGTPAFLALQRSRLVAAVAAGDAERPRPPPIFSPSVAVTGTRPRFAGAFARYADHG